MKTPIVPPCPYNGCEGRAHGYAELRPTLFTDDGQRKVLAFRDAAFRLLKTSGAIRAQELTVASGTGGDVWEQLACIDRLVELGDLREIPQASRMAQHRVFVAGREIP